MKQESLAFMRRRFNEEIRILNVPVQTGVFGADMKVSLLNDGPVTLIVEKQPPC